MATRKETLAELSSKIKDGNISDAYRTFEDLPVVDQIAVSIAPGVGDVLAAYEIKEFGSRGAKNVQDKDYLGAAGNYGMSALSGISLIPLLRFVRGARPLAKAASKTTPPPKKAPAKIEAPKEKVALPKIQEFKPLSLNDMKYQGTSEDLSDGLTSKAAKFINLNNKLPNQAPIQTYIAKLKNATTDGELRLLNIIDDLGDIHPKLLSELGVRSPSNKITRQRLAQYIKSNQEGALQKRFMRRRDHEAIDRIADQGGEYSNEMQSIYMVRGVDRKSQFDHYRSTPEKREIYSFDATTDFNFNPGDMPSEIDGVFLRGMTNTGNRNFLNIGRIQSDYAEELGRARKEKALNLQYAIKNNIDLENFYYKFKEDLMSAGNTRTSSGASTFIQQMQEAIRKNPKISDKDLLNILKKDFAGSNLKPLFKIKNVREYKNAYLRVVKDVYESSPKPTPYVDPVQLKALKESLVEYNNVVNKKNKIRLQIGPLRAQKKKLMENQTTENLKKVDAINAKITKLGDEYGDLIDKTPKESNFDQFTIKPKDIEDVTGKPFTDSLDKSIDEIFYDLERLDGGGIRQKYGPGTPGERALKYFNELANDSSSSFDIGDGIKILKQAVRIDPKIMDGYPADAYAKGTRTEATKLPVRANVLRAVKEGRDGVYMDSGIKRLGDEGGLSSDILVTTYKEAESEIAKILKELDLPSDEYLRKVAGKANQSRSSSIKSGTYLKIDDKLREAVEKLGINAFKDGGSVDIDNTSDVRQELESRLNEGESIDKILKDLLKDEFQDNYGQLVNPFTKQQDNFIDTAEQKLDDAFDFKYKDDLLDIIQSDNPEENIKNRLENKSTDTINDMLDNLNMPSVRRNNSGTSFDKTFDLNPKTNINLEAYKPDDGNFRGNLNLNYANRGKFGNLDIQSAIDEMGNTDTRAKYRKNIGPLNIRADKRPGRDATGSVEYNLANKSVGNYKNLSINAVVNNLLEAKGQIDYMYNNSNTGGYFNAGLGLDSRFGPELNIGFGRNF